MQYWLVISCIALAILGAVKAYTKEFSYAEFFVSFILVAVISGIIIAVVSYTNMSDIQIINGQVVNKEMEQVHCRHSYSCHCYTTCSGSGSNRHCSEYCQTCYRHKFDQDWTVFTTVGNFDIDTIDSQGLIEPPSYTAAYIGEPAQARSLYQNYIKASPDSLFHKITSHKYVIPQYPDKVTGYYHHNRVVVVNANINFSSEVNQLLNNFLITLGPKKQVNIVPVFTNYDRDFGESLEQEWIGGKKNDVVIVIGLDKDQRTIKWTKVFSWSKSTLVNYEIQDYVMAMKEFDPDKFVFGVAGIIDKSFVRRSMKEFEYLKDSIEPPDWAIVTGIILMLVSVVGCSFYFSRKDIQL